MDHRVRSLGLGGNLCIVADLACCLGISMLYQTRQGGNAPDLERMNYINSLAYLMKGLPSNLTPAEASTIRQTTPVAVLGPQQGDYFGQESPMPPVQRNWVHSTALILLNWLAALIAWLVPLTRHALLELAQFEKDNQYFSKMALSTLSGVRNAYVWFSSAYAGQVMAAIMGYFFQGVQGAVTEFRTQPVAMRSSSGNYLGQQQQQFSPRQEGKERRQYEQQQHHHQHGYPPQHYTRDFGQLRRQGS
ncbi:hypothetical protein B0T21DRAFT_191616 [Apiosordaria backusii]|uniref:Uncharacterized protein n=1 Tax=Apiosordaria backusii TaxID=314023 RepID=A0AA40EBU9_9PEZI|nr:hypothetical protein B0T21DRAFT_191616 [Apiosordaria backusii]